MTAVHRTCGAGYLLLALLLGVAMGCDTVSEECVVVQEACNPIYQPVFDEVFARTIQASCAVGGSACHSGVNAKAGLRMDEPDETYRLLVEEGRVLPGDAACSLLSKRLAGIGEVMPPGAPLPVGERCAIEQWIANGAKR